jgi:hypothetical protein
LIDGLSSGESFMVAVKAGHSLLESYAGDKDYGDAPGLGCRMSVYVVSKIICLVMSISL